MSEPLPIIYQDAQLIAVHKPAGLLVHRTGIDRHETRFAVQLLRDQIGQRVYPVHRLDKGTSGVLLFALDPQMARDLARQFAVGQVDKQYLAVVRGYPPEQGVIDHPLDRLIDDYADGSGRQIVAADPQPAVTGYRRLATVELPVAVDRYPCSRYALLAVQPQTGRRHQIRRHLKHIAHPIIGDVRYGKGNHNRYFRETLATPRLLLACVAMRVQHPASGEWLCLHQAVDGVYRELLARWHWPLDIC